MVALLLALTACDDGADRLTSGDAIVGDSIPNPLAQINGDAEEGRAIFVDRERGHCILCHQIEGLDAPFQGDVGPDLSDIGMRLTTGQIRFRIVDASQLNGETVMPPYYRTHDLRRVAPDYAGEPILTAEEIEHLVAYLAALKG